MGAETGEDIVFWAIEQGVLEGDSGGELIGIPSFSSAQSSMMVPIKSQNEPLELFIYRANILMLLIIMIDLFSSF